MPSGWRSPGAFHSPLVELAAERLRPEIDKIDFKVPTAHFVSTVTAKLEDATRFRSLLVERAHPRRSSSPRLRER